MLQYNLTCLHSRPKIPQSKILLKTFQTSLLFSTALSQHILLVPLQVLLHVCGFSLSPQATFCVNNVYRAWNKSLGQGYNLFSPSPGSTPKHKYPKGPLKPPKRMEEGARSFPPGAEPALIHLSANHSIPFCS